VSTEQLEQSNKDFGEAMDLRDADPGAAVRLFAEVLRTRVAHFGETALEVAPVYMRYGMSLFEQAQMNQDYFGDKVQSAAAARDAAARGEESDGSDSDEAVEEENAEEEQPSNAPAEPGDQPLAEPSTEAAAAEEQAQQPSEPDDADDMQIAWENLELARIIYEKHGGAEQHASDLAEIHNYTGDIFSEQEKFEEAIDEYNKCITMLARLPKEDKRRAAQVYFKQALAQQFNDQFQDALNAITTARTKLTAHRDALHKQLEDLPAPPAAANAAAAAFAAAVASFAAAPASGAADAGAAAAADQNHEAAAKATCLRKELGDINAVLEDLADKADELRAAIATEASMKDALRSAMRSVADAEQLAPTGGAGAGSSAGPSSSNDPAAAAGAQVQDLGVVGKGRRVAPVPVSAPTPAAAPAAVEEATANGGGGVPSEQTAGGAGGDGGAEEASTHAAAPAAAGGGGGSKRSLEDLMGGGAAGATTMIGFGASKAELLKGAKKIKADAAGDGDQGPQQQQVQDPQE
jgi:hypothetical protein